MSALNIVSRTRENIEYADDGPSIVFVVRIVTIYKTSVSTYINLANIWLISTDIDIDRVGGGGGCVLVFTKLRL